MSMLRAATSSFFLAVALVAVSASAVSLASLSNGDVNGALREALDKGSVAAVGKLGVENGFLNNDKVRIPLPRILEQARPLLKMTGHGRQLDDLVVSMNHAAEAAVPLAKPLLLDAVRSMSLSDAKNIVTGGDTSVTNFFRDKTSAKLGAQFLPIVKNVTDRSDLSGKYNGLVSQASKLGLGQQQTVEQYVTERALDGLFTMIGEEEKAIRSDPLGTGSKLIGKVFGALR